MLSLESLDIEGLVVFLLSHTDLKSDACSVVFIGEFVVSEFAASKRSPSADGSGTKPNCGVDASGGAGGISGNGMGISGNGISIPGGGGGNGIMVSSESASTSSKGSFTDSFRSSTLFNILWLRNRDDSIAHFFP